MPESIVNTSFMDWVTLVAVFFGPITAVFVTRVIDSARENKARKLELFRTLMMTRGSRLNQDHVAALNLIEIEYYKKAHVLDALERYFEHLNDRVIQGTLWVDRGNQRFTKLMYEMAVSLGYDIEQLQILTGGYAPQGWLDIEQQQGDFRKGVLALLRGEIALPVRDGSGIAQPLPSAASSNVSASPAFTPPPGFPPIP